MNNNNENSMAQENGSAKILIFPGWLSIPLVKSLVFPSIIADVIISLSITLKYSVLKLVQALFTLVV